MYRRGGHLKPAGECLPATNHTQSNHKSKHGAHWRPRFLGLPLQNCRVSCIHFSLLLVRISSDGFFSCVTRTIPMDFIPAVTRTIARPTRRGQTLPYDS
ncbi:hypothetical protein THAOC_14681 [Thalassiosira oceanica]|uniref:Uncharacterized protein n=1 Tax=Thalassiosira oceanica TaxID=159749 RepID=K0T291_THAOC|nr:hypothetical protein THAOC_14681 [Thalassiosira oceanica]|eukprot:EJK64572.1 hypothetical protein THAOC_14681 [Thalassiosira oceanica]